MNKYQKQAVFDMVKVAVGILVVIASVQIIIFLGMAATDLVALLSFGVMVYAIYQLFLIRVGQLESEDKNPRG
jgi:hypothetical protein